MREVEKFQLDRVSLTSMHGKGPGTGLLQRGWTLFHSGVADSDRWREGVAIHLAPRFSACTIKVTPVNNRVASLRLWGVGRILTIVCAYVPNSRLAQPPFFESFEGVLESAPSVRSRMDFVVVSPDLRPHVLDTRVKRGAELSTHRLAPESETGPHRRQ